jgi:hypothetical protein
MGSRERRGRRGGGGRRRAAPDRTVQGSPVGRGCRWTATGYEHYRAAVDAAAAHRVVVYCLPLAVVSGYACGRVGDDVSAIGGLPTVALVMAVMFASMGMPAVARYAHALLIRTLLAGDGPSREAQAWPSMSTGTRPVLILVPNPGHDRESD